MPGIYDDHDSSGMLDFMSMDVLEISDQEILDHLAAEGLDIENEPYSCSQEIAKHWNLPYVEADRMRGYASVTFAKAKRGY